ncbi:LysR family transcriptional regulator [Brevibacillus fluminis]|uniref:LysR family transcriptional regulator n=1 Tax=Brevibacillus fluminis TaxID=511487 RepID=A0A3M8CZA2_9BACL|nr:LysR family transcriptional regulator [Brevibacillus fluminis]RNB81043.1 LysR family transcriptional regulator [Brevibacillus fluminis]
MTLMQAQVFLAVVETGTFTKAGERLNLSQSGVSHTISGLETELGIQLLVRNRHGIKLTQAGERILAHVREMVNRAEQIRQIAADTIGMSIGTIRIGSFPSASAKLLPGIIRSFQEQFPQIELVFCEGTYGQIVQWLHVGEVDAAFVTLPTPGFDSIALIEDPLVAVLPHDHSLVGKNVVTHEEIAAEPFILPLAGCEKLVLESFQRAGATPQIRFEVADNPTILAMVKEGLGLSIVPRLTLPTSLDRVVAVPLAMEAARSIGLAVPVLDDAAPAVKAFRQSALEWVGQYRERL